MLAVTHIKVSQACLSRQKLCRTYEFGYWSKNPSLQPKHKRWWYICMAKLNWGAKLFSSSIKIWEQ